MKDIASLADDFCNGQYDSELKESLWASIFSYLSNNHEQLEFAKDRVHTLWTENGGNLRRKIKNDELITKVLSVALPGYSGEGLTLYRGECRFLYESNQIGFCWTPEIQVATKFARGLNSVESGGVLLKAFAPSTAILASPNKHSSTQMREFEYTCNPKLLTNIELVSTYRKPDY